MLSLTNPINGKPYDKMNNNLLESCIIVDNESMINAAKECTANVNEIGFAECTVSAGGTWQKIGHDSF